MVHRFPAHKMLQRSPRILPWEWERGVLWHVVGRELCSCREPLAHEVLQVTQCDLGKAPALFHHG
jgi:hypothetical protein